MVAYDTAVQAIEQALADAEKYKYLLMRALRRHADDLQPATPAPVRLADIRPAFPAAAPEAPVLPMYPALAA